MCCCLDRLVLFLHSFPEKTRPPPSHTFLLNIFPTFSNSSQMFIDQAHFLRHPTQKKTEKKNPQASKSVFIKSAGRYWFHCALICGSRCLIVITGPLLISSMMSLSHFISSKCLSPCSLSMVDDLHKSRQNAQKNCLLKEDTAAGSDTNIFHTRWPNDRRLAINITISPQNAHIWPEMISDRTRERRG